MKNLYSATLKSAKPQKLRMTLPIPTLSYKNIFFPLVPQSKSRGKKLEIYFSFFL